MVWNPLNFLRGKAKREKEIQKILSDLNQYKTERAEVLGEDWKNIKAGARRIPEITRDAVVNTAKAAGKGGIKVAKNPRVQAAALAYGTVVTPGIPFAVPAYAKSIAQSEIYAIAERVAASVYRRDPSGRGVIEEINKEIDKQFKIKDFKRGWFSSNEMRSTILAGAKSGREQVQYYEQEFGGRLSGQAVQKLEQAGAATSTIAQKTPGVGTMLFGTVPKEPAKRTESIDPRIRSVMNKARLELQKESKAMYEEFKREKAKLEKQAEPLLKELKQLDDILQKTNQQINAELAKEESPGAQNEGGPAGVLGGG